MFGGSVVIGLAFLIIAFFVIRWGIRNSRRADVDHQKKMIKLGDELAEDVEEFEKNHPSDKSKVNKKKTKDFLKQ